MNLRLFTKIPPYPFWGFFDHSNNSVLLRKQPILARTLECPAMTIRPVGSSLAVNMMLHLPPESANG
jgi:hypothetical protein